MSHLDDAASRLLWLDAHTHYAWTPQPVEEQLLLRLYELARLGPTAMNSQPMRVLFVKTRESKERLRPALAPGNVEKTMAAPVTAIVAFDTRFFEKLPRLAPHAPEQAARIASLSEENRERMARFSATLQAAYLIVVARGLGLDTGPMAGFDLARVDADFFPDGSWKSLLLINLGYGDPAGLRPRAPRLDFDEACRID